MAYGITDSGFNIKSFYTIKKEIENDYLAIYPDLNLDPTTTQGQLIDLEADRLNKIWQLAAGIYSAQFPTTAEGQALDNVASYLGLTRLQPTYSNVDVLFYGTNGTIIDAGFSVADTNSINYETISQITLDTQTSEIQRVIFSPVPTAGTYVITFNSVQTIQFAYNATAATIQTYMRGLYPYLEVTGDISTGFNFDFKDFTSYTLMTIVGSPTFNSTPLIKRLVEGNKYSKTVSCSCTELGIKTTYAYQVTNITTPQTGLTGIINFADNIAGRELETDAEFRARREFSIVTTYGGTLNGIKNALLKINETKSTDLIGTVYVFENDSDVTNGNGLPPHSIEVFVDGGDSYNQEIANTLYNDAKPCGIQTYGDDEYTVVDSMGFSHTVYFSRPVDVNIYLELDITVNSDYPTNGDDTLKQLIIDRGTLLGVGKDVIIYPTLISWLTVEGIEDVVVRIGRSINPTLDSNIDIDDGTGGIIEISKWSSVNITITQV